MSGYTDEISKTSFLQGDLHFIEKPFTSNSLAQKIREVMDNEAPRGRSGRRAVKTKAQTRHGESASRN
jgi:hypothetical protein